jgi:hypothetical protein
MVGYHDPRDALLAVNHPTRTHLSNKQIVPVVVGRCDCEEKKRRKKVGIGLMALAFIPGHDGFMTNTWTNDVQNKDAVSIKTCSTTSRAGQKPLASSLPLLRRGSTSVD